MAQEMCQHLLGPFFDGWWPQLGSVGGGNGNNGGDDMAMLLAHS